MKGVGTQAAAAAVVMGQAVAAVSNKLEAAVVCR